MDFNSYLILFANRSDLPLMMEPPKSPKFNVALWQPWLAEKQGIHPAKTEKSLRYVNYFRISMRRTFRWKRGFLSRVQ
jgi:hypothetical protein